jgi:hypothetical protein
MQEIQLLQDFIHSRETKEGIVAAYGYGSGVFKQKGYTISKKPMIDSIIVVKDSVNWHRENKKENPKDYHFGSKIIFGNINLERISFLTGVTYHTHIAFQDRLFKYGIVNEETFLRQMKTWNSFFLPGRFQKPVLPIKETEQIKDAIFENRRMALLVGLLTLPRTEMTLKGLYTHICSLSYLGDIRMLFVENPNKVNNIVEAEFSLFEEIYGRENEYFFTNENDDIFIHYEKLLEDMDTYLPEAFSDVIHEQNPYPSDQIYRYLKKTNHFESIVQPMVGILTNGPVVSLKYMHEKILKKEKRL